MLKAIVKWFIPGADSLSELAASKIAQAVNESEKTQIISKYATYADKVTEIQKKVTQWLIDGKIDSMEEKEIAKELEPVMKSLLELI